MIIVASLNNLKVFREGCVIIHYDKLRQSIDEKYVTYKTGHSIDLSTLKAGRTSLELMVLMDTK